MTKPLWEKIISIIIYMLPWSGALIFGKYLFADFAFLKIFVIPILPIILIGRLIPFGNILLFIFLFFGIVRNSNISYFLRFNTLQAILINIGLIIINFIFQILFQPFGNTLLIRTFSSTIFISILGIIVFCILECLQGKEPDLPNISEAVRIQL